MPDGENFVVAGSKQPAGGKEAELDGSVRSSKSDSGYAKPVEELSYGLVHNTSSVFISENYGIVINFPNNLTFLEPHSSQSYIMTSVDRFATFLYDPFLLCTCICV